MATISFRAPIDTINTWHLIILPRDISAAFSSRSQVMVTGTLNDYPFHAGLEPDGKGSHWLRITDSLLQSLQVKPGDFVSVHMEQTKVWPEPEVPADITKALAADAQADVLWLKVTPMARWEWIRWIRATGRQETRAHRIEVALSKLKHGERRPCCFNRAMCTEFAVAKGGVLLDPER